MEPPAKAQSSSRIPELDGVRGVAILLVVICHYFGGDTHGPPNFPFSLVKDVVSLFWCGVDLFFVLSGFLIGGILMDQRNSAGYFKTFYVRRVCRILPLYFAWIALFFLVIAVFPAVVRSGWYSVEFRQLPHFSGWGYFLFVQNFWIAKFNDYGPDWTGNTWSLCVEEHFYLLAPLTIWLLPPRKLPMALVSLIVLMPVFRLYLYLYHSSIFMHVFSPCRMDGLLLGMMCAWLVRNEKYYDLFKRRMDWVYVTLAMLFGGMIYLTFFQARAGWFKGLTSLEMVVFGYSWISLFFACFLLVVITAGTSPLTGLMRNRWLRHLGVISYCVYLVHGPVNDFVDHFIYGKDTNINNFWDATAALLSFAIVWLIASASWRFFEKPIIAWGHSFLYEKRKASRASEVQKDEKTIIAT